MIHGSRGSLKGNFFKRHLTKWNANISEFVGCRWRSADTETHSTECLLGVFLPSVRHVLRQAWRSPPAGNHPDYLCHLLPLWGPLSPAPCVSLRRQFPCSVTLSPQMSPPGDWEQLPGGSSEDVLVSHSRTSDGFCGTGSLINLWNLFSFFCFNKLACHIFMLKT